MSPFHVWVTEVQRVPALAELALRSGTTSSPRSRPSLPSDGVPVLSLCPPDPRWPGAVWIGEPGTGDLGPGSQQPPAQGPPDAEQQCQDHLGLGRTQPLWVTPETTSAGDVVFKLSLRRKKKARGQQREEVAWAGPPGESRPAPLHPRPGPHRGSQQRRPVPVCPGRTRVWDTGGAGGTGGGSPTKRVPTGIRRTAPAQRRGSRKRSDQPQGTCCPSMLVARKWGALVPTQHLSPLGSGSQQTGGGSEGQRSCPRVAQSVAGARAWVSSLWLSSSTWPCPSPRMGASVVLVRSWVAQASLGGWPLLPDRPAWS